MNARENYLEAIRFGSPEYVPMTVEEIWHGVELAGNWKGVDWKDQWGVDWKVGLEGTVPFPKGNPLESLDSLDEYRFPEPGDLVLTEEMKSALDEVDRGEKLVVGSMAYLLFERAWAVMGMENFLMALATHPEECHAFLHGIAAYSRGVFDRYLELGVDAISFSEDLGSQRALMMSPAMFRQFILPEYEYAFENVLAAGKIVNFHSCGCVDAIAGDLASIGVTILNPVQARANDLPKLKKETQGHTALLGGIDTAVLAGGTTDDVRKEVARILEIFKPGGGYVCGPDQSIPGVPPENMDALWETARELGKY